MKKIILSLFVFISLLCLKANAQITVENNQIAPDFATFKGTLLVLENRDFADNTLNRMTKRKFEKNYKGDFEMIDADDYASNSYKDKKKYRFVVQLRNSRTGNNVHNGAGSNGRGAGDQYGNSTDNTKFVMTDRLTGKEYETRVYTNWTNLMGNYSDALEKARFKE
jgi:hypothetical protein